METRYEIIHPQTVHVSVACRVVYDDGVLSIEGYDQNTTAVIKVEFGNVVHVRISDEGGRIRLLQAMGNQRGLVMIDKRSTLLDWVIEEALETRQPSQLKHYLIFLGEEVIDVIAPASPEVQLVR
jgi:hypothetical protein